MLRHHFTLRSSTGVLGSRILSSIYTLLTLGIDVYNAFQVACPRIDKIQIIT